MISSSMRERKVIAAFVAALIGAIFISTPLRADQPANSGSMLYSAQAIGVRIDGATNVGPIVISDTGMIAASGGAKAASQSNIDIANGGLKVDSVDAEAEGSGPASSAEARVTKFHAEVLMWTGNIVIEADYINAEATVSANPGGHISLDSAVRIQNLTVNGQPVTVSGRANQEVRFPDDTRLIINETVSSETKNSGDIQIIGLHFWACDVEGRVCIIHSGLTVNGKPPTPSDCGKVTGGGWIAVNSSGAKGTFGMSGGIRRGEFWGHLTYIDHDTGMKVESTAVTNFQNDPASANGRIITYAVTINGTPGTARLRVVDNGEPGRNDIFDLTLSTGYHAGGDLGGSHPGGGNIQLHKCPPGWE